MNVAATDTAKKTRTKKGEGPYTLSFVDGDNKDSPRIPAVVSALKVEDKESKKSKSYSIQGLSPVVLQQLAADGLKRRLDAFIRNSIGGEKTAIVLADEMYGNIKSGKLYLKGEGGGKGAGRTFNFDLYINAMERNAKLRNESDPKKFKLATKQQLASLRVKLEAATPAERKALIKGWSGDPIFMLAKKQVEAEQAATAVKGAKDEVNALDSLF